ncbi:MAG: Stk1 family PASTA domain-containing Ser/Thr kinase [Oscillospiraceae bacterium]|nr:Stk1 family PASTA domain-containing Ser/Thr kinase [Oscillospiraceae bacterium]
MEKGNDKNIGKKLDGRYEITELIGEGGMADVYRATDTVDHKTVAVKILKKEFAENEEFLRRFRNESKAIAVLSHPNIVKVYDVGFSERIQFIVMEYIDGITLNEYMEQEGPLNWKDAVHFILQILRALQHAHSKGIVHRDIKPQNIMMLKDGTIKVMDFGIAKFAREEAKDTSDKAIGTVHYISPEQARGGDTDAKSDIYSVGVMLYEMMTGKKPFDSDKPVSIAVMHMQAEIPLPHTVREDIPVGMEEIILKAMQKDPGDRYQTARDMMDDIATFKENQGVIFGYFPNILGAAPPSDEGTRVYVPSPEEEEFIEEEDDDEYGGEFQPEEAEDYDDDEDDDEYEEEEGRSFFVPILSAVIIVVIVIAAVLGTSIMWDLIQSRISGNKAEEYAMPNLVGMDYNAAKLQYGAMIDFDVWSREYSKYEKDTIFEQSIPAMDPVQKGDKVKVKVSMGAQKVKFQDMTNWDYETAKQTIMGLGLQPDPRNEYNNEIAAGKVIRTDPVGPCELEPGTYVTIWKSLGENKQTVAVPTFTSLSWDDARQLAENNNLTVSKKEVNDTAPQGYVLRQSIDPDTQVTAGSTVELEVSNGIPLPVEMRVVFDIPANAAGTFHITMWEGGIPTYQGQSFNVAYATNTFIVVKGNGIQEFTATLTNDATNATETIGKYSVDFDKKVATKITEDVTAAFEAVGGLAVTTSTLPPGVTTTVSTSTTPAHGSTSVTKPSTTTPAVTTSTTPPTTTSVTTTKTTTSATTTSTTPAPPRVEPEAPEKPENQQ